MCFTTYTHAAPGHMRPNTTALSGLALSRSSLWLKQLACSSAAASTYKLSLLSHLTSMYVREGGYLYTVVVKKDQVFVEMITLVSSHTSDFEPQMAELFVN